MKMKRKGTNLVLAWKNVTWMKSRQCIDTLMKAVLYFLLALTHFYLFSVCFNPNSKINAIRRMKSSFESRRSSWRFIIQVRAAANGALYSRVVKCTNVLHSCGGESSVQGRQILDCPRRCPLLLQIVFFHILILEGRGEKKEEKLKKTDKKTRGRVNSSCSISVVAMDTNPA